MCDGLTNREIARTMSYSVKTVEVYLTRLYAKTNCRSRNELARAVDRGHLTALLPRS
ncbi:MAG: LuxR C-terminal-related transcriptional regulator [Ilumatobacteraceae bacterium]